MPISKVSVLNNSWIAIGSAVSSITFQNIGQFPVYINFTANNSPPVANTGIVYDIFQGELKQPLTDLTFVVSPNHVWARSVGASTSLAIES
jgi:hypothetical protein